MGKYISEPDVPIRAVISLGSTTRPAKIDNLPIERMKSYLIEAVDIR